MSHDEPATNGTRSWGRAALSVLIPLLVAAVVGAMGWLFGVSQQVTALEARANAAENRLGAMESGRTTPMAAETRAEFNAVWREIDRIRSK